LIRLAIDEFIIVSDGVFMNPATIYVAVDNERGNMDESRNISMGSVKIVSGGEEYWPRTDNLFGLNGGVFYDAVKSQPHDIADGLVPIPVAYDFTVVIEGGIRWGDRAFTLYKLTDDEWVIVAENFEDPPEFSESAWEPGEYILCAVLGWQNGLEGNRLAGSTPAGSSAPCPTTRYAYACTPRSTRTMILMSATT